MVKKIFKRTLSIFLTLVLLVSTFFIFDPSTLKMDAKAWVDVEANKQGSSIASQIANAPETIYLKPGSNNFQYFSLIDVDTGKAGNSKATTGTVSFSNPDATSVKIYVNNLWHRTSKSSYTYEDFATSNLQLNVSQNITKAGVSGTASTVTSGTVLASGTNSASFNITQNSMLLNATEGDVYIIEWVVAYTVKDKNGTAQNRLEFMYTGIYKPMLQLTGVTGRAKHTGSLGNEPSASGFLFVTGAMNYAQVGNRSHAFTKKENDFASGVTARPYLAPLLGFQGQKNNGSVYTVPSVSNGHASEANFPTTGTKTVMVCPNTVNEESANFYFFTDYANTGWGSYANPTGISGSNNGDVSDAGMTTAGVYSGIAYEVVDTSRFTDYNQIPNFSVGYVRYYAKRGGEYAYLDYIRLQGGSAHKDKASLGVAAAVDRSDFDEDDDNARTWGLYTLNGPIQNGGTYVSSRYRHDLSGFDRECNLYLGVGLMTTAVNKADIRSAYCEGLKSNIDRINDSGFSSYYSSMRTQARILCDPTATTNTVSISKDTIAAKQKDIIKNNTAATLFFYVPEAIYLKPADRKTFQYYVDRENADNGALRTGENGTGNVYFHVPGASSVSVSCSGATVSLGASSGSSTLSTTINSGSVSTALAQNATSTIEWTGTYVLNGSTYTVKNYTTVYSPFQTPIALQMSVRNKQSDGDKCVQTAHTIWAVGIHGIQNTTTGQNTNDALAGMKNPPMTDSNVWSYSVGRNTEVSTGNDLKYVSGGTGYNGWWNKVSPSSGGNSGASRIGYYEGIVYYDSSRVTNLNHIPNLKVGLDLNLQYKNSDYVQLGCYLEGSSANHNNLVNETGQVVDVNSENGGKRYGNKAMNLAVGSQEKIAYISGYTEAKANWSYKCNATSTLLVHCKPISKGALRSSFNTELGTGKDKNWYTDASWTTYQNALKTAAQALGNPLETSANIESAATSLNTAAAGLVKKTGTATVNHVKSTGGNLQTAETKTYEYGDTVYAGSNDFTGYTLTGAVRTAPSSKTLTINTVADDPDGKDATDEVKNCTSATSTWTFTYTPNKYDITYIPDGGTFNGQTGNKTYADIATYDANFNVGAVANGGSAVANPTKTGYDFNGWKFSLDGKTYKDPNSTSSPTAINPWNYDTDTAAFTALWTPHEYNIEFNGNTATGGSTSMMPNVVYDSGVILNKNGFTKTGYAFAGWAESASGAVKYADEEEVHNLTSTNGATVTLYAKWTPLSYTATAYSYSNSASNATTWSNNANGGTVQVNSATAGSTSTASISYGTKYTLTASTAKTGYFFVGWYSAVPTSANTASARVATTATYQPTMGNAEQKYYARYDIEQYTINFYRNYTSSDATITKTLTNAKYGTSQAVTIPTYTGYAFKGWYDARSNGNQIYGTTSPITVKDHGNNNATVNLYAQWTPNTITVTYKAGTGSGTAPANHTFSYGSSVTPKANTFTAPAKITVTFDANGGSCATASADSTFTFANWKSDKNGTTYVAGTAVSDNLGATSGTVTLTAQWTQSKVTLPTPTRTGYTFNGWYTAASGGTKIGGAGSSITPTASTKLYAQWTVNAHDVNVYAYGNSVTGTTTWTSGVGGTVSGAGTYNYGASLPISATAATGYKFVGWYTAAPTSGTTWGSTVTPASTMGESNLTYYARFDLVYCTVTAYAYSNTFDAQTSWANNTTGGTVTVAGDTTGTAGATSSGKVITGKSATLTASPVSGYHFVGWYTAAPTNGTTWGTAAGTSTTLTVAYNASGATRYARFDININTLKVDKNDGSTPATYSKAGGQTQTVSNPTRTGYTFGGWTKSPATLNGTLSGTTYTFPTSVYGQTDTLTAKWTVNKYTITFNKNDAAASGTMSDMTNCAYDTEYTLTANAYTKTGYSFAGWATSTSGSVAYADGAKVSKLSSTNGATVNLYAKWTVNNYKFDLNGKLDGTTGGNIAGYGKADVYVNGTLKGNQVTDFYQDVPYGATYEIKNITTTEGHYYVGVATGSLTGTMPANNTGVTLEFATEQYTINFYKNDGTSATHSVLSNVKYGTSQSVTVPTRTGYTFKGWYDATTGGNQFLNTTTTTFTVADYGNNNAVKNYYAQWTINQYTIKAYAMTEGTNGAFTNSTTGGTVKINTTAAGAIASVTVDYNTALTYTPTPATGYTFSGWYSNADCTTAATTISKATENKTYYAKFTISKYTLTVKGYGNSAAATGTYSAGVGGTVKIGSGTAGASATLSINYNGTATITATPATGYKFDGWYKTVTTGSGDTVTGWSNQYTGSSCEAMTTNRTYYAKFSIKSVKVTYDSNGGTNGAVTSATVYYGQALTIGATPTRTGYKLLGWADASNATAATYTTSVPATTVNTWVDAGTKTIYAVWKQYQYDTKVFAASNNNNDIGTYKINTTGGTASLKSGVTSINTGDNILDKLTITPAAGYEFVEVKYRVVDSFPSSGSAVTPSTSPWSGAYSTSNASYKTMPEFADGSKVAFIAYFRVRQFESIAYAYSNSVSGSYTNSAIGGTVKCGQDGAPGATAQETVYFGDTNGITFYATPNTGYTFEGWFNDASFTSAASNTNASLKSVKVIVADNSSNANINKRYAKFSINTHNAYARAKYYTEGFNKVTGAGLNGVTGGTVKVATSSSNATTTNNNAVSIAVKYKDLVTYTATPKTGYEFAGWYSSTNTADDANIEDAEILEPDLVYTTYMPDNDIRIHAKFVPANFVVTLNANGGTSGTVAEVTLTYGQSVTLTSEAKPIWSSYNFIGWAESSTATKPDYDHKNSNCTIAVEVVNRWFTSLPEGEDHCEIYAIWETATYIVTFDDQGGTGGPTQVQVTLGKDMPTITSIPTYDGYKFKGYYSESDCTDESTKYYNADGTSAQTWNIADGAKLYAKWVCPILKDAIYDKDTGTWAYIYEGANGSDVTTKPTTETLTKQGITDKAPTGAKEITSTEATSVDPVKNRIKATEAIDLNHYTTKALEQLLTNVTQTNTDLKRENLNQVELNEYVAKLARYTDINAAENMKVTEKVKPTIKLYETKEKIKYVKDDTLTKDESVIKENYGKPASNDGSSYIYTNKYSERKNGAVDYYIYTNSRNPVIALEIDDGKVGTSVTNNTASYPTKSIVESDYDSTVVSSKANNVMTSAVPATDDINTAWFSRYTKANIGVGYDYNAKEIVYLTPTFTPQSMTSTTDEIVYTITPSDDAVAPNTGLAKSEIADIPAMQADKFSTFKTEKGSAESITVCVCYHNAMNGDLDEGGALGEQYFQMYIDQPTVENAYYDLWLDQMHLFRQAGGANNWEIINSKESVYPVQDETFKDTGYVLGSFAYVFDATNEPIAAGYAEANNYDAAKDAIIKSIKNTASEKQAAIADKTHSEHITQGGLGLFELGGWSTNFYPKKGSYVYAHLVDRWGNYFNKVWKCFNVDAYTSIVSGSVSAGFKVTEDGGSNIATITIDNANIDFLTDLDSNYSDNVFITSGNEFTIATGKPKTRLPMVIRDNAGNETKGNIPTDEQGNIKFTIDDLCADLSDGAYTFMFNDTEVNLYAREPELVRAASMTNVVFVGETAEVKVVTSANATKVQLVENGLTRTYDKYSSKAVVTENEDGTLTWTITVSTLQLGDNSFDIRAKDVNNGWQDSQFTVSTKVVNRPSTVEKAIVSMAATKSYVGDKSVVRIETKAGTEAIRVFNDDGYSKTVARDEVVVSETDDGNEIWTIICCAYNAEGTYTLKAYAYYKGEAQKDYVVSNTVTVSAKIVDGAIIYTTNILNKEIKSGEKATIKIVTNTKATKVQLIYGGTTTTYTSANATVVDNGDGSLEWTIQKGFYTYGETEVMVKAKSSAGWTDAETVGTVTLSK